MEPFIWSSPQSCDLRAQEGKVPPQASQLWPTCSGKPTLALALVLTRCHGLSLGICPVLFLALPDCQPYYLLSHFLSCFTP